MLKMMINGQEREYAEGTSFRQIAEEYQKDYANDIVLVKMNGRLRELFKHAQDGTLEFVTTEDEIGMQTYRRSMLFLTIKSIYDVTNHEIRKVTVQFSLSKGLYIEIDSDHKVDAELVAKIDARIREMVDKKLPIMKKSMTADDAMESFGEHGMTDKEKLFKYRRASRVNIYSINEFEDYYYGYMLPDTGYLKYFQLIPFDEGLVLQMPEKKAPKVVPPFEASMKLFTTMKESARWGEKLGITTVGDLNEVIVRGELSELVLIQEALMEKKLGDIAAMIAADRKKKLVMLAGPSSSGKTTTSHRLSIQLKTLGLNPHPIAVDNYFVDREFTPRDADGNYNFECLECVDLELFNRDMTALLNGERVELPVFNFKTGKKEYKGDYLQLGPDDILVIEGIHCLNDKLSYSLPMENKFKIYLSALTQLNVDEHNRISTTDGRLIRRIVRDARTRGADAQKTISMWPSVRRGEQENIFPYQETADVVLNTALIYELAVLKPFAEPLLFAVPRNCPEYLEAKRLLKFFDYFLVAGTEDIARNSILREFIGGSCFHA
ncbi:MAG: nucleoside kinase [Lachnospiraceae bacterium]|nr:nucleoside kinase [Lachnospiraceae bacterium]